MLYIRMFLSMIVGLYTSRVVLNTLGVEDYGIYGVVGGIVAMMGFLNASMSGATSRFITFELGKGNQQRLNDTFSSAMIVHIGIAIVVLIVAETAGLWFLENKLVIPDGRMEAAHWVYQLSIASAMLGITQVPYNACIIAHERMGVYAYIEILNVTLKLLIVYLLTIGDFDKLKLYAVLTFIVSIIVLMTTRIYSMRKFSECHFHWVWKKEILRPLLSFSGWDLYGNMCVTARQQGTNFLINMFFGVALNAASSIATTVSGIVTGLSGNIVQAFRPQIIKQYAANNIEQMQRLMIDAITCVILFIGCISIPIIFEANYLLKLWLGIAPPYASIFCQLILLYYIIDTNNKIINIAIHATGKIIALSFFSGTIFLLCIPFIYLMYFQNNNVYWAYIIQVFSAPIIVSIGISILKYHIPTISILSYLKRIIICFLVLVIDAIVIYFIDKLLDESILRLCIVAVLSLIVICLIAYIFFIDKNSRFLIKTRIFSTFFNCK